MKLSICMMVKNEEKNLDRCLKSLQHLRDSVTSELIIVDTGSTDKTVEIANKYTDKVHFHSWNNDFSEMRNITIGHAKGDWIFIIDADEELTNSDKIINFLKSNNENKYNTISILVKNFSDISENKYAVIMSQRFFRNDGNFKYIGAVHNNPLSKPPYIKIDSMLNHYGYIKNDKELMERKFKRTATILKNEIEKNPSSIYYRFQLSASYRMHGDYEEALQEILKAYEIMKENNLDPKEFLYLYYQLAFCYDDNKMVIQCRDACLEGLKYEIEYIDLYFYLGKCEAKLGNYEEAINAYKKYIYLIENYNSTKIKDNELVICNTIGLIEDAYYTISVLYFNKEQYKDAIYYIEKLESSEYISKSIKMTISLYIKMKQYEKLFDYYCIVNSKYNSLRYYFIETLEMYENGLEKDEKLEIISAFQKSNDEYGKLNEIRFCYEKEDKSTYDKILHFINSYEFNKLDDFYGDIIYILLKNKYLIYGLLFDIKNENLNMFLKYIFAKYGNEAIKTVKDYLIDFVDEKDLKYLRINVFVLRYILILGGVNYELFQLYIDNGIKYILSVYSNEIIENEYITLVNSDEDRFFIYLNKAYQNKDNEHELLEYIKKALYVYPAMKDGINFLIDELSKSKINNEFESYKLQVKEAIKNFIDNGDLVNAEALIKEYESIVKDDVEIVLFKSQIVLKKTQNTNFKLIH